jgi:succinate dehydrogenase/fumarate reductase flavoprotein subunit
MVDELLQKQSRRAALEASPTNSYDVVVVGSGAAGLFSAIAASRLGLSCLVLEKADRFGGGTAGSAGFLWVGMNHLFAAAGGHDSREEVTAYLRHVGAGGLDADRMRAFVETAPRALRFFAECVLPFEITSRVDHYGGAPGAKSPGRIVELPPIDLRQLGVYGEAIELPAGPLYRLGGKALLSLGGANSPRAWDAAKALERDHPTQAGGGAGLVGWLIRRAAEMNVALQAGTAVESLITEEGRVVGVTTVDEERIGARRGVVIATGGYESNAELVNSFESLPGWQSMFPETLTGDGLIMASEIGAAVRTISNNLSIFLGFRNPDEAPGGTAVCRLSGTLELSSPHTIVVNRDGRRFADETFFQAVAPSLRTFDLRTRRLPNLPCWLIFDQQYVDRHSFGGRPPGVPIPEWVASAGSLPALGRALGLDGEALAETVERFNTDITNGVDREFHRGEGNWGLSRFRPGETIGTIERPSFYGIELHPTALASAGLLTDSQARVTHVRGRPIPGLYAVGNACVRNETGSGYQTGYSLASSMAFGLIAAEMLAVAQAVDAPLGGRSARAGQR